ncbi:hypothetical protein V8E54_012949 [Elaphomyces granulatus]
MWYLTRQENSILTCHTSKVNCSKLLIKDETLMVVRNARLRINGLSVGTWDDELDPNRPRVDIVELLISTMRLRGNGLAALTLMNIVVHLENEVGDERRPNNRPDLVVNPFPYHQETRDEDYRHYRLPAGAVQATISTQQRQPTLLHGDPDVELLLFPHLYPHGYGHFVRGERVELEQAASNTANIVDLFKRQHYNSLQWQLYVVSLATIPSEIDLSCNHSCCLFHKPVVVHFDPHILVRHSPSQDEDFTSYTRYRPWIPGPEESLRFEAELVCTQIYHAIFGQRKATKFEEITWNIFNIAVYGKFMFISTTGQQEMSHWILKRDLQASTHDLLSAILSFERTLTYQQKPSRCMVRAEFRTSDKASHVAP